MLSDQFEPASVRSLELSLRDMLDLSRIHAAPSARLGHFLFERDWAFPAQWRVATTRIVVAVEAMLAQKLLIIVRAVLAATIRVVDTAAWG